jgi:hypothetical protein
MDMSRVRTGLPQNAPITTAFAARSQNSLRSSANRDDDVKASGLLFGFDLDNDVNIIPDRTQKSLHAKIGAFK